MKKPIIFILIFILVFNFSLALGDNEDTDDLKEILENIDEEEKRILQDLFTMVQEIEEMERESQRIERDIDLTKMNIENTDLRIKEEEIIYDKNLAALEGVLASYQRMGPGSYIEIILSSKNLNDLLKRINILRDLTKNTDGLLSDIEVSKARLVEERAKLDQEKQNLETRQKDLTINIENLGQKIKEQEAYLEALQSDKEIYLERLDYISLMMDELKIILGEFTRGFAKILKEGSFPPDAVKQTITLKGIRGTIKEETFNTIINSYDWMPKVVIRLKKGEIAILAPEKGLELYGDFQIMGPRTLRFDPKKGSFLGMPLEKGTLDSLFEEGDFLLDLEPLIDKNTLRDVDILDKELEVLVSIKLF